MSHEKWGQIPVAYIVGHVNRTVLEDALYAKHSKYKVPKDFVFLEALPKKWVSKDFTCRIGETL